MAGEVKHKDVGPELTYDEYHSADSHTIDGVEAGTVIAGKTTLVEVKADTDIVDAISKSHSNTLDHTQGTDQGLDTGGVNAVTAAEVKGAVTNSHAPGSDDQVIPTQLSDLSDDENHRLVTDTEKGTWNGKATVADVKADEDVASAISNSHASGSDNQDLSGLVPYSGATGDVALGTHSLGCAGVSATGNVVGKTIIGDDLILWDTGETPGDPTISMVSGDVGNSLTLSTDGTVAEIVSNNKMFHFRTGENIIRFIKSLYEYWFTIDLTGANPQLTSYTGEIGFDNENLTTTGNATAATLKATSNIYINETSNAKSTIGLTINQGENDNEILTLKSSDVSHPVTTYTEADTYGFFSKPSATGGGLQIISVTDTSIDGALILSGVLGVADPTNTHSAIHLTGRKYNGGTSATLLDDAETVLKVINHTSTLFTMLGSGAIGIGGTTPAYNIGIWGEKSVTDPPVAYQGFAIGIKPTFTTASSQNTFVGNFYVFPVVANTYTCSGTARALLIQAMRNNNGASVDDSGTLSTMQGLYVQVGHYNADTGETPITTNAYAINVKPWIYYGTIGNYYGLYLDTSSGTGTITNRYGVYQVDASAKNYFAGMVGIGTVFEEAGSTNTLNIANGTAPDAHVDNQVIIYSTDSSDSAATLGLYLEQAVEDIGTFTASHKIKIKINGVEYWLQLDAV